MVLNKIRMIQEELVVGEVFFVAKVRKNLLRQYNEERPHESLGDMTPAEFLMKNSPKEVSTFGWH